jgi:hypothetical protein
LLDGDLVLTCARVVAEALGLTEAPQEPPSAPVVLAFLNSETHARCRARVVEGGWFPAFGAGAEQPGDIALLELDRETSAPLGPVPAPLGPALSDWDRVPFYAYGFPEHAADTSVTGVIAGPAGPDGRHGLAGSEWAKLQADEDVGERILPGFSGAPVWDTRSAITTEQSADERPKPQR